MRNSTHKPIKITFDANPLLGKRAGIGHYTARLIEALATNYPDIELIGYYYNFLGRKKAPTSPTASNISYRPILFAPGPVVHRLRRAGLEIPLELLTFQKTDFILFTNFLGYPSLFHTPTTTVIYDLTYIDVPEFGAEKNVRDLQRFMKKVVDRSSFIVTISDFSKQRIQETYDVPSEKILKTFIPAKPPLHLSDTKNAELLAAADIDKSYFFSIGTLEPRKNLIKLFEAYALLPKKIRDTYALVIAGKVDWKYKETKERLDQLIDEGYDIRYLGYIDDATQAALYKNATLYIMPSLYEGFGMPIIEAMSYGTPSAVSNMAVLREIGKDKAAYFNPHESADIAKTIKRCLDGNDTAQRNELIDYSRTFPTWSDIAKEVIEKIESTIDTSH